jgi:hypothetical protein
VLIYLDALLKIAPKQQRIQLRERSLLSLHRDAKPCLTVNLMLRANTEAPSEIAARAGVQWTCSLQVPNVSDGSKTVLTPLKWDVCITPRKQTSVSYAVDGDLVVCYGGAKLTGQAPRLQDPSIIFLFSSPACEAPGRFFDRPLAVLPCS